MKLKAHKDLRDEPAAEVDALDGRGEGVDEDEAVVVGQQAAVEIGVKRLIAKRSGGLWLQE